MRSLRIFAALTSTALLLGGCSATTLGDSASGSEDVAAPVTHQIGTSALRNLSYVLSDTTLRSRLADAGKSFTVVLRDGSAFLPVSDPRFQQVSLLEDTITYGDVTGDGQEEVALVLRIGEGTGAIFETEIVAMGDGRPAHLASYSLGNATLKELSIRRGSVRVEFMRTLPGDPGPSRAVRTFSVTVPRSAASEGNGGE